MVRMREGGRKTQRQGGLSEKIPESGTHTTRLTAFLILQGQLWLDDVKGKVCVGCINKSLHTKLSL